jgi:Tol biopolymer transport system component
MRVSTVHSTIALWIFVSSSPLVLAQTSSHSAEGGTLPPGAVSLVNQDRFGSKVALCAETGEAAVQQGARRIRGTAVWAGERTNLRRIRAGLGACDPAWSPDGRRLAVTAAEGLWVFAANSTEGMLRVESRLPQGSREYNYRAFSSPRWSPDGVLVALVVTNGGTAWVEVFDANSGRLFYTSPPENYTFTWTSARELKLRDTEIHLPRQ